MCTHIYKYVYMLIMLIIMLYEIIQLFYVVCYKPIHMICNMTCTPSPPTKVSLLRVLESNFPGDPL